jgi:hypothetical protein
MKLRMPIALSIVVAAILMGCNTSQQTTAYNTIYSLEKSTTAAYTGYIDLVIQGTVSTNALPVVSKAYNNFQAAAATATDAANFSTNALAPASLVTLAQDVINEITVAKGH